jgi:hypothetical protein
VHLTSLQVQVLGDLGTGLAGADHEHGSLGELGGVPVAGGLQLSDPRVDRARPRRHDRDVVAAGGDDHRVGLPGLLAILAGHGEDEAAAVPFGKRGDPGMLAYRRAERRRVAGEPLGNLVAGHEAVRVGSVVGVAGESAVPVGGDQGEVVPPGVGPLVGDGLRLEHHVLDPGAGQVPAGGEPGLAAADHGDGNAADTHRGSWT